MIPAHRRHDISDKARSGHYWNRIYRGAKVHGAGWQRIIGCLSMLFSGLFAQVRRGATCRLIWGTGATRIGVLSAGEIKASGKNCWKF